MQKNAHIVGAGVSGLSAAVRLANANYRVHVHEATQQAGGRKAGNAGADDMRVFLHQMIA